MAIGIWCQILNHNPCHYSAMADVHFGAAPKVGPPSGGMAVGFPAHTLPHGNANGSVGDILFQSPLRTIPLQFTYVRGNAIAGVRVSNSKNAPYLGFLISMFSGAPEPRQSNRQVSSCPGI